MIVCCSFWCRFIENWHRMFGIRYFRNDKILKGTQIGGEKLNFDEKKHMLQQMHIFV